jgi:lysophospholipase L1-like esterase
MKTRLALFAASLVVASAGEPLPPDGPPPGGRESPAFARITDVPSLPRVLLIGDSISIGYTAAVRRALADRANVHRAPVNCGPSSKGATELAAWLGTGRWDVIHFNFGLHDVRRLEGGVLNVSPEAYAANLRRIVAKLRQTGATLIWATTTPVPAKLKAGQYPRDPADIGRYNAIAAAIMTEAGVKTNDLHAVLRDRLGALQHPEDVHLNDRGYAALAAQVCAMIAENLPAKRDL